jgi:probable phosphoglycerate mutase
MVLSVYLVRHGQTAWSLSGRHTGLTDIALTSRGEDEARELALYLAKVEFSRVLTSPLRRARATCELSGLGAGAQVDPDLAEWDYGQYEGRRSSDIRQKNPVWLLFRDGCPGGETVAEVSDRADRLIGRLEGSHGNVALFSHGQFLQALAARWIEAPMLEAQRFPLRTGSVSILSFNPDHPEVRVIALWGAGPKLLAGRTPRVAV